MPVPHENLDARIFVDWHALEQQLIALRKAGNRIVLTNGCFDLLHTGHLYVLGQARQQGDVLVVALNSDESIQRLKGPQRPIKPLHERARMLAALRDVDFVVVFSQDTPQQLIQQLTPDVLVKGGDYQAETIVGYKEVTARGGRVHIVPFIDGLSTTNLITTIRTRGS